jgi:hypothetical protein
LRTALTLLAVSVMPNALSAAEEEPPVPCASAAHAQFDFWIGEWEVTRPDGTPAGSSRIEKILGGCVVFENWKSATSAYEGKSFNTLDPVTGKWNQVWVDNTGATLHFSGVFRDNVMDMEGTQATADGTLLHRMLFTRNPEGTISQLWRQSRDGKEWETLFDGLYRRKK